MKNLTGLLTLLLMLNFTAAVYAQKDCKVLMPSIDSIYTGKCKKGLANGKGLAIGEDKYEGRFKKGWPDGEGTYTWSTGEVYTGHFAHGIKSGEGAYTFTINGNDTTLSGLWENDQYVGAAPKKPKVMRKVNVDTYSLIKRSDAQNKVLFNFKQNGGTNMEISDLFITADSGFEYTAGRMVGYRDVKFPVTVQLRYKTPNKLHTMVLTSIFEITIYEPGDWLVELVN